MNTVDFLSSQWKLSNLNSGNTILIHSSLKSISQFLYKNDYKKFSVEDIFNSFLQAVGSDGTLLFPLFNFEFTKKNFFDIKNSKSQMGSLSEYARNYPGSIRTGHPIYSFAVIGKNAHHFEDLDNVSGYGIDSPFALLKDLQGKIGILGLEDQNSMTFYHYVEEFMKVDYRYFKEFSGIYVDKNGSEKNKTYKLFVRDLERGIETRVNPMGELLWEKGIYKGFRHNEPNFFRTITAAELFSETVDIINNNLAIDYLYTEKL
tara:strand:+ start:23984 stop:24766 length:783 start_codon:yes stop_codon:yes gene_type:complete